MARWTTPHEPEEAKHHDKLKDAAE
jgi:hypothetical protein